MNNSNIFQPNWASIPGNTIGEVLSQRKVPLNEFAEKMGFTYEEVKSLIYGAMPIDAEVASKLANTIGSTASFWLNREQNYQASVKYLKDEEGSKWLEELPIKDMVSLGWLQRSSNMVQSCLAYFDVPNVWVWRKKYSEQIATTAFKKSDKLKSNATAISAWIRHGEIEAASTVCKKWNPELLKNSLPQIRKLIKRKNAYAFIPQLKKIFIECGVALIIAETPTHCPASGATKFINQDKAMILLSFKYRSDDKFWFTLFHEIGHLLLHGDTHLFIDSDDIKSVGFQEEEEGNSFAFDILISKELQPLLSTMAITDFAFKDFAKKADVPLGIVIGQLQKMERIPYSHFTKYIRRYSKDEVYAKY